MEQLLRRAMPPVGDHDEFSKDLWPHLRARMQAETPAAPVGVRVPWFDWALVLGLVALLAFFPAWIPVLLYYL